MSFIDPIQATISRKQLPECLLNSILTSKKEALKHSGNNADAC